MREDYQALIDEVCALLGTPATLEGRDFALIAFGAHEGDGDGTEPALDPVRRRSILGRRSSAEVRAWFESFGITRATGPVRIDPDPAAGVEHGRICLPVRHGGVVHGYIWLMDDGALDLADPRLASAMALASRIGALLAAEARAEARTGELLRAVLTEDERGRGEQAAELPELAELLGPAASGPLALLAVVPWRPEGGAVSGDGTGVPVPPYVMARCVLASAAAGLPEHPAAGSQLGSRTDARTGSQGPPAGDRPVLAAVVRLRSAEARDPARTAAGRLLAGVPHSPAVAGLSAPRRGLAEVVAAWREALAAARAAHAEPERLGPVAEWEAIGPYRLLTALTGASAGRAGAVGDPAVAPLLRPAHAELARTAEVFLDHAGQAGRTAAALGIHRQTLYYRLSRIEALTGLDLDEGSARLLLHMTLKAARL
jgi:hypothetical protein